MKKIFYISLALVLFIGSCGRKTVVRKYYLIKTGPVEQSNSEVLTNYSCQVEPVDVYPEFTTERIAQRNESHEIVYYSNHFWAIKPGEIMTRILENQLSKSGIFSNVDTRFFANTPNYLLETTVYQIEVLEIEKTLNAHLHLEFDLKENISGKTLLTHSIDRVKPLPDRDMNSFAAAISELYQEEIKSLANKLITYFETK